MGNLNIKQIFENPEGASTGELAFISFLRIVGALRLQLVMLRSSFSIFVQFDNKPTPVYKRIITMH